MDRSAFITQALLDSTEAVKAFNGLNNEYVACEWQDDGSDMLAHRVDFEFRSPITGGEAAARFSLCIARRSSL